MNKEKFQVFTPYKNVSELLDEAGYTNNIYNKTILENSCGDGSILTQVVQRYIIDCTKNNFDNDQIRIGLQNNICAYDTDDIRVIECIQNLTAIALNYGISHVNWNVNCQDFLRLDINKKFDYVIGNPPYISYSEDRKSVV